MKSPCSDKTQMRQNPNATLARFNKTLTCQNRGAMQQNPQWNKNGHFLCTVKNYELSISLTNKSGFLLYQWFFPRIIV